MDKIGKYEIRSELGRGAMGIVYLGYDPVIERSVAIKTMNAEAFEEEEQKQRFLREARSAGAMQHPNIVTIYEMGMEGDTPYIAMEYVEGQDLTQLIKKGEPESLKEKLAIMAQLCDALDFAHSKEVIHRDIKPGNIRILPDRTVKIMDFGIAKKQDSDFTRTGLVVGTLSYMSPEQVQGKPLDPRSDQFSAGVVFYQMLTGKKPFGGDNLTNVIYQIISFNVNTLELPGTPTVLKKIVQKMMNPDPEKRFRSCGEVSALLRQEIQFLEGEGESPTVLLDTESPTETAVVPPIPSAGNAVYGGSVSLPETKKSHTFAIVLSILIVVGILGVGGVLGYKKFSQFQQFTKSKENAALKADRPKSVHAVENPEQKLTPEMKQSEEQAVAKPVVNEPSSSTKAVEDLNGKKAVLPHHKVAVPAETVTQQKSIESTKRSKTEKKEVKAVQQRKPEQENVPAEKIDEPETVFKKEGQNRQVLALHKVFAAYEQRIEKFKNRVENMPMRQRKAMFSREMNMGRRALGDKNKIPAAVHFYRSVILQPTSRDGYAWLAATLIDLKAYEDARKVIKKAGEHGISVSQMSQNMRFRMAYQKLQMH